MKELVVISGKGGTGKTSLVASLAALAPPVVLVDCDVDAADLHLILEPEVIHREDFVGGSKARSRPRHCTGCGRCVQLCRFGAVEWYGTGHGPEEWGVRINQLACEGCGVCAEFCPAKAIELVPVVSGAVVHLGQPLRPPGPCSLGVAAENSGKLVTQLRRAARRSPERGFELIIWTVHPASAAR